MIRSRVRQPPSAGGQLSKNTAKLRTPKKTTKKAARTNLKSRPAEQNTLGWNSGKVRLEMLSPDVIREAKQSADQASHTTLPTSVGSNNPNHMSAIDEHAEKIELARKLNAEAAASGTTIPDDLKATIAVLASEGKKVAEQLKEIQGDKADRVDQLERTISDLRFELDTAKSTSLMGPLPPPMDIPPSLIEGDIALAMVDRLKGDNAALRRSLDESNGLIEKLKAALHTQESEIKTITGSLSELRIKESKSRDTLAHEEDLRARLKKELQKKTMEADRYTARVRRLEAQVRNWKGGEELVHVQAALARASAENVAKDGEINELRDALRQSESRVEMGAIEKTKLESEMKGLNPRLKGFEEQDRIIRTLEHRLAERDTIIDQLRARLESLDHGKLSKISDLEHQLATIEVELARKKRASLDTQLKLEKSQKDLDVLACTSNAHLVSAKDELVQTKAEAAQLREKLEGLGTKYNDLSERHDIGQKSLIEKEEELRKLTAQNAHNASELEQVQKLATRSSEQLLKIQQQCNNAIGMKTAAERQLEMACAEIRKAEERQGRIREDHQNELAKSSAALQAQLSKLNAEIHSGKEELREIERRSQRAIEDLERRLRQSEQMNQSLQEYVAYLKSMSDALTR